MTIIQATLDIPRLQMFYGRLSHDGTYSVRSCDNCISVVIRWGIVHLNNPQNLNLSCKIDLDLWDYFDREKNIVEGEKPITCNQLLITFKITNISKDSLTTKNTVWTQFLF